MIPPAFADIIIQFRGFFHDIAERGGSEYGIIRAHPQVIRPGDHVVIVGGGDGRTVLSAADLIREKGSVTVYEAGDRSVQQIRSLVAATGITDVCTIHHTLVGPHIDVYGGDYSEASFLAPDDLPPCDVLELDCEGAEVAILGSLQIQPRAIIVEIHPRCFREDPQWVLDRLAELGYTIVYRSGHEGIELTEDEVHLLLMRSRIRRTYLKNGARSPVVVAALRNASDKGNGLYHDHV